MKIVVIGGSGLIGSKLVNKLRERGHEASPTSGVNTLTGEGLAEALEGAAVVVDVTNAPSWEDATVMEFFDTSTRNLLAHGAAAGVGHHVALSVVGTERMLTGGYFRAKMAQEDLIKNSSIPYSIIRATQFFEFVKGIVDFITWRHVLTVTRVATVSVPIVAGTCARRGAGFSRFLQLVPGEGESQTTGKLCVLHFFYKGHLNIANLCNGRTKRKWGAMLNLESGDRIELFYGDSPEATIRATVTRFLSDRDKGIGLV